MIKITLIAGAAATLIATAAAAADLPYRKGPPVYTPPPPVFTWTGFYFGTHSGYDFSDRQRVTTSGLYGDVPTRGGGEGGGGSPQPAAAVAATSLGTFGPHTVTTKYSGFANVGGDIGYNYQFTPGYGFVVGIQGDFDWTDVGHTTEYRPFPGYVAQYRQRLDFLATVTGKVGYAFDRLLIYGLGGAAFGDVDDRGQFYVPGRSSPTYTGRYNDWETGYAYGGGVEYAFGPDSFFGRYNLMNLIGIKTAAVTIKAEYIHYDLGTRSVRISDVTSGSSDYYISRFRTEGNFVRAGFNYKF